MTVSPGAGLVTTTAGDCTERVLRVTVSDAATLAPLVGLFLPFLSLLIEAGH